MSIVVLKVYQDDVTCVVIGRAAAHATEQGFRRVVTGGFEIEVSEREEASQPFGSSFTLIGSTYDVKDLDDIQCRPRVEAVEKFRQEVDMFAAQEGKLIPRQQKESLVGLMQFVSRFVHDGAFLCNSAYRCLRTRPGTRRDMSIVGRDLVRDARQLVDCLARGQLPLITNMPVFWHAGCQGANSDASGSSAAQEQGWGVHVQDVIACDNWPDGIRAVLRDGTLSISPLELLSVAISLLVGARHGVLHKKGAVVLRNDNESSFNAVNTGRAYSLPMLEALRIFKEVQAAVEVKVWMHHVSGDKNAIAD